jgi:hypothetical protein
MFSGITTHVGSLVTAIVVLTGAAILRGGAAAADDPNQDDQFLALLNKEDIPAVSGVPSLIDTAHRVCRALDAGTPVDAVVAAMVDNANIFTPGADPGRLRRTEARFITAAVEAYCPYNQGKIASIMANPAPGWNEPTHRVAAYTHNAVNSGGDLPEPPPARDSSVFVAGRCGDDRSDCDAHGTVLASLIGAGPSGEMTPSPIPAPPPPAAQTQTPPRLIAAPPPPKQPPLQQQPPPPPEQPPLPPEQPPPPPEQPPPPPEQPPPPPQQPPPPPQQPPPPPQQPPPPPQQPPPPPQQPPPTPPMAPGRVRLAP